jgi:hypothetical protein
MSPPSAFGLGERLVAARDVLGRHRAAVGVGEDAGGGGGVGVAVGVDADDDLDLAASIFTPDHAPVASGSVSQAGAGGDGDDELISLAAWSSPSMATSWANPGSRQPHRDDKPEEDRRSSRCREKVRPLVTIQDPDAVDRRRVGAAVAGVEG